MTLFSIRYKNKLNGCFYEHAPPNSIQLVDFVDHEAQRFVAVCVGTQVGQTSLSLCNFLLVYSNKQGYFGHASLLSSV